MPSLTDVYITVKADTSKFDADLRRQLHGVDVSKDGKRVGDGFAGGFGSSLKGLAASASAAFAALKVGEFLKGSVTQASDLAESVNVVGLTFRDAGAGLDEFFAGSATSLGMSAAAARQAASNIGGLLNNMGFTRQASADTSKAVLTLGADMGSAFNKDPALAVEAIGSALRGETEPIRAFNVTLSDATVKAKALEMGLYSGKGAIDANAKAQATLALIMQQTADVQGDFANTSQGLANSQRIAAAGWLNLKGIIGTAFLPVQTQLTNQFNSVLLPALTEFATDKAPKVADWFSRMAIGAQGLADLIVNGNYGASLREAFGWEEDSTAVDRILRIRDAAQGLWDLVIGGDFTGNLRKAFGWEEDSTAVDTILRIRDAVISAKDEVAAFFSSAKSGDREALAAQFASVWDSVKKLTPVFREFMAQMPEFASVAGLVVDALAFLADHTDTLIRLMPFIVAGFVLLKTAQLAAMGVAIANLPIRAAEIAAMIIQGRGNAALAFQMSVLTGVQQRSTVATIAGTIATRAKAVVTGIAAAATALYTGIMQRGLIMQQLSALATYGQSTAFGTLTLSQKVAVVATKAVAAAQWLWNAALTANPIGLVVVAIGALVGGLILAYTKVDWFRKGVDAALNWIKDAFQWLYDFLLGHSLIPDLINGIIGWFTKLGSMLRSVTSGIVTVLAGVWDGVTAAFDVAMSGMRAVYNTVVAPVFSLFGGAARLLGEGVGAVWGGIRAGFAVAMSGFGGVYQSLVAPVLSAFNAAALVLWTGVQVAWDGIKAGFGAAMAGFMAVYDNVIAPVFGAFKVAAQFLWDGVEIVWAGIKAGFGLAMTGLKVVYDNVVAPVFATFEAAAGLLWEGVKFFWEAIKIDFALAMAGIGAVYDNVIRPLFAAFKVAAEFLWDGVKVIWSAMETGFDLYMRGVRAVYDKVIVPLFDAFKVAAQSLWDGVEVIFEGIRTAFDLAMQGVRTVYDKVIVPLFDAYKTAAQLLRDGVQVIWDGMRDGFDRVMRAMRTVYDNVVKPLFDTFALGVQGLNAVFDGVVSAIGKTWDTLKEKLRAPIKVAFDWVNSDVIGAMNSVLSKFPGGLSIPSLPSLREGGPVKGPGGPRDDKVLMWGSDGEFMVNAAATKKHRRLLEDINKGRAPTRLPGDEIGGWAPGDVWEGFKGGLGAIGDFAADMIAKGARKAAELLLNPIKDRLFSLIGAPDNVAAAVVRGGLEKLFAAVFAKGDEKDKEMDAAKKAGAGGGGIGTAPGGGSQANLVAFGRLMQSMNARASEHPAFGGVNMTGHSRNSPHYVGRAIDLNYGPGGENNIEKAFFDRISAQGLPRQYGLRQIWRAPGHFNHMHVDYDKGGYLQPGAMGVNRGARPERVLTATQTDAFDRLVKVLERGQGPSRPPLVVNAYGTREDVLAERVIEGLRRRDALYQMG